jgi:hypothetical protein
MRTIGEGAPREMAVGQRAEEERPAVLHHLFPEARRQGMTLGPSHAGPGCVVLTTHWAITTVAPRTDDLVPALAPLCMLSVPDQSQAAANHPFSLQCRPVSAPPFAQFPVQRGAEARKHDCGVSTAGSRARRDPSAKLFDFLFVQIAPSAQREWKTLCPDGEDAILQNGYRGHSRPSRPSKPCSGRAPSLELPCWDTEVAVSVSDSTVPSAIDQEHQPNQQARSP